MAGGGIFNIAVQGLNAAQAAIRTTEHNISNANKTGYKRQEVDFETPKPQFLGGTYFGTGIEIGTVRSIYSQFLNNEVLANQTMLSRYMASSDRASQVDKLLGDKNSGIQTTLDSFFSAIQEVANDPISMSARQNMLATGNNMAARFNTLADKLDALSAETNNDVVSIARQINVLTSQIAETNSAVATSKAAGHTANDLVDKRDQLIQELGKLVNVSRIENQDGSATVTLANGQALVMNEVVAKIDWKYEGNQKVPVMSQTLTSYEQLMANPTPLENASANLVLNQNQITGGELGGVLDFRRNILNPALADLDRIAMGVASSVNALHRAGLDYNMAAGGDFFNNPVMPQGATVGELVMTIVNDQLIDPLGYSISLNGGGYDFTSHSTGVTTTYASLAAVNAANLGFTLADGVPPSAAGESWELGNYAHQMRVQITNTSEIAAAEATATGPGNNANALLMAGIRSTKIMNGGTATLSDAYVSVVTYTASAAAQADLNASTYQILTDNATSTRQSLEGVNLDEEAANLIRFQQAYQASARAIQVATDLFNELLNAVR